MAKVRAGNAQRAAAIGAEGVGVITGQTPFSRSRQCAKLLANDSGVVIASASTAVAG